MARTDGLAARLIAIGVRHAFGVTGSGLSWDLISELERGGVRYLPAGHEAAAAIMAGAATRCLGAPAISLSIKGPGVANMAAGIAYNHFEHLPALSISECFADADPSYRMHKRIDHRALLRAQAKACLPGALERDDLGAIWQLARSEVSGPIHLDLTSTVHPIPTPEASPRPGPGILEQAIARIAAAQRPIVIAGSLALRRAWGKRLASLHIPVFTTAAAKGAVDERTAHAAGVFTGAGREQAPEVALLPEADLVIGLGLRNLEVLAPGGAAGIHLIVDEAGGRLADGFAPSLHLVDGTGMAFDPVLDALAEHVWGGEWIAGILAKMRAAQAELGWMPGACFAALNRLSWDHNLVVDTGSFCTIAEHIWQASPDRPFHGSSNGRFMGGGLPTALGVAVADPGRPVICTIGDGGMRMYPGEFKLAIAERLPICLVLMRDGRYGSIACASGGRILSQRAVDIPGPSWRLAVEGMGCQAIEATGEDAFLTALSAWDRKQPLFLEAVFDPDKYSLITNLLR